MCNFRRFLPLFIVVNDVFNLSYVAFRVVVGLIVVAGVLLAGVAFSMAVSVGLMLAVCVGIERHIDVSFLCR